MSALADRRASETVCPHCGGRLAPEQDWCLECGAAVRIRIRPAPDWRIPLAIVAGVVALVAVGFVVVLVALSNSANQSVPTVAASAPTTRAATSPATTTPTASAKTTSTPTSTTTPTGSAIGSWPAGVTGFTVVLDVVPAKATATASATKVAAAGIPVGVLFSSDYSSMHPGDWIVFSGTYTTRAQAAAAASQIQAKGQTGAYAFSVVPAAH